MNVHNGNVAQHRTQARTAADPVTIFREANHRIANNLSLIAAWVRLRAAELGKDANEPFSAAEVAAELHEIAIRVTTVGRLHRLLTDQTSSRKLDLGEHLRETCHALVGSLAPADQLSLIEDFAPDCTVPPDRILPVTFIVSEMVTNAIKYAHPTGVAGKIHVTCRRGDDGSVAITVADDGVGLPEGFDPETDGGMGFRSMRMLAEQLGATLTIAPANLGCRLQLQLPPASV